TDIAGASLILAGGRGTGSAAGGDILFQTSNAGSSGTTLQSLSTKMAITAAGNVGIGTTSPGSRLVVQGSGTTAATSALNVTNSSGNSALFVRDDGHVGIGTTNPYAGL